jgi:saccharopine dehydrogenase-like NADP-dependent oxidoreductase
VSEAPKEKVLIVGLGKVGHALFELFTENRKFDVYWFDVKTEKVLKIPKETELPKKIEVMQIAKKIV